MRHQPTFIYIAIVILVAGLAYYLLIKPSRAWDSPYVDEAVEHVECGDKPALVRTRIARFPLDSLNERDQTRVKAHCDWRKSQAQ